MERFFSTLMQKPNYRNELISSFSLLPDDAFDSNLDKLQLFIIKRLNRLDDEKMGQVIIWSNRLFNDSFIDGGEFFGKKDISTIDNMYKTIGTISFILTNITTDDGEWEEAVTLVKKCMRFSIADFIYIPKYTDELNDRIKHIKDYLIYKDDDL